MNVRVSPSFKHESHSQAGISSWLVRPLLRAVEMVLIFPAMTLRNPILSAALFRLPITS